MKKYLSILFVSALLISAFSAGMVTVAGNLETNTYGDYAYQVADGVAAIIDVDTDISGDVVIPSSMDGYRVTGIHERAFDKCDKIVTLKIPAGITYIEQGAFEECDSLTKFIVAFGSKDFCTRDGVLYSKDITTLICYPPAKTDKTFAVPDGVKKVDMLAFAHGPYLEKITVADGVESLGDQAFYECTALKEIVFGLGLEKIGTEAFAYCSALASFTIPNSVKSVGTAAFMECRHLSEVTIGSGLAALSGTLFLNCTAVTSVELPSNVTAVGGSAFSGCSALQSVTVSKSVEQIGAYAFYNCDKLNAVSYTGSEAERDALVIGAKNDALVAAEWQYDAAPVSAPSRDATVGPQPLGGPDSNVIWGWVMIGGFVVVLIVAIVVLIAVLVNGVKRRK